MFWRIGEVFADRTLQLLLLGVIAVGLLFAFVLDADAYVVFGIIAAGFVTAFIESAHHRHMK